MDLNTVFPLDQLLTKYVTAFKDKRFCDINTTTYDPIHYFISHEGKQIRPLLLLASCNLFCGDLEEALNPAYGIQMFHNFTLVHDDIMDNADIRRGRPSVHKKFGSNRAIIAGDIMMIYAYDYLYNVAPSHFREIYTNFNRTAIQVIEGQQMDIDFESRATVNQSEYIQMIAYKTSVLLAESLRIGGIIANAPAQDKQLLYNFGLNLGLSFQIKDDWLDAFGKGERFGKKIGGDILQNKKTMLFIKAWEMANTTTKSKINDVLECTDEDMKIKGMLAIYNDLGVGTAVETLMADYFKKSLGYLAEIKVEEDRKRELIGFANQIYYRDH